MKYAFMTFSTPSLTLDQVLATAKRYGYDGIEPRLVDRQAHGIEVEISSAARREARAKVADSGIALACIATSCMYANPATTQANVDETFRCIDLAGDLGAPTIRVFGGKLGPGLSRADAIQLVAESLLKVAGQAAARGVTVCVETHDDWCEPTHLAAVLKQVNHPAIAINWDIMHPVRVAGATMDSAFEAIKPWIGHVHLHDGAKDGTTALAPIGEGAIDHKRAVELLLSLPYRGFLSGEWIKWADPYEVHLPRELATMKSYEQLASSHLRR
ncbi:MAG: sugar phosphate isomerase/epimerase [Chloroflexi bacterium]|nr:sugar phosphate isomerase/epimerase [Chloroflexota bacterium]